MNHINILITACFLTLAIQSHGQGFQLTCPESTLTLCEPDDRIDLPSNNQSIVGIGTPGVSSCSAHVRFNAQLSGDCGIIVQYYVEMLPFDGNSRVRIQDTTEVFYDMNGEAEAVLDTRLLGTSQVLLNGIEYNSPCQDDAGGYHRLWWYAMDECGNIDSCTMLLRLEDCLAPLAEPVDVTMIEFPLDQTVTIVASELIEEAVDDCDPINWLLYSFDENIFLPTKIVNCDTIAANGSPLFQFDIWVGGRGPDRNCNGINEWEEFNKVKVQALVAFEDDCAGELFDGTILSENGVPVEGVIVSFFGSGPVETVITDADGEYRLPEIDTTQDWTIFPAKTGDETDGISTLDLIRIQKHLLGIEELDSPFKHIAADANNSQSISAVDLLELRKLILRITSTLPNNTSWRFVPRSYEFPDSTDPWPFAEQSDLTELDFIGIKVGDVNGTVSEPSRDPYGVFDLHFPDGTIESNSTTRIPVLAGSNVELQGLQLTLESINGRITNLEDGLLDVSDGMFAIHKHAVAVAWHTVSPVQVVDGDTLFYIQFYPDVRTSIHDAISTSSRLISAEAYALTDREDRKLGIQSEFVPGKLTDGLEIFPNPAVNEINVRLKPGFGDVRYIRIYDVNGTLLVHTNKSRRANGAFSVHFASDMPRGLYIIGVETTTGQILHRKVIVGS